MNATEAKIESFWKWFIAFENQIRDFFEDTPNIDKDSLTEEINNQVLDFGMFTWEIGQGSDKPYYLTISPNGNRERLKLSKKIMKASPEMPEWQFNHSKPSKEGALKFRIYDNFMNECSVDASEWNYALQQFPDQTIGIILETGNINHLDSETQSTACDLVITNILGEELKILYVRNVAFVTKLEAFHSKNSAPLGELKSQFEEMLLRT